MISHDFPRFSHESLGKNHGFFTPTQWTQDLQLLHHHEPRLRGPSRAAGQLEGALSDGGDDGAGLRHHGTKRRSGVGMVGIL